MHSTSQQWTMQTQEASTSCLQPLYMYMHVHAVHAVHVIHAVHASQLHILQPWARQPQGVSLTCAAGTSMPELISELIWAPIGAKEDADFTLDHFRTPIYNGGMCATLHGKKRPPSVACVPNPAW